MGDSLERQAFGSAAWWEHASELTARRGGGDWLRVGIQLTAEQVQILPDPVPSPIASTGIASAQLWVRERPNDVRSIKAHRWIGGMVGTCAGRGSGAFDSSQRMVSALPSKQVQILPDPFRGVVSTDMKKSLPVATAEILPRASGDTERLVRRRQ